MCAVVINCDNDEYVCVCVYPLYLRVYVYVSWILSLNCSCLFYLKVTKFSDILNLAILVVSLNLNLRNVWLINYINSQFHKITNFCMH